MQNLFPMKPTHDIFTVRRINRRKPFKTSTKKRVWMKAGGYNPDKWRTSFIKTSKCMSPRCKTKFRWGDRSYEFDHKDNNNSNNSERNCFLVCLVHHRRATVIKRKVVKDRFTGLYMEHKTIKKKVGYKKQARRKTKPKGRRKTQPRGIFDFRLDW